jgi:HD-like signal output (HDOD) protein
MNNILEKLKISMKTSRGIPALEGTANEVLSRLRDENKLRNFSEMVELITRDVALTQKILKLVNSPMYAPFSKGTKSISEALRILGVRAVVHLILSAMIIDDDSASSDEDIARALIASDLAKTVSSADAVEDSSIAALLYNMGKMITKKFLPEEYAAIEKLAKEGTESLVAEKNVMGIEYTELGAEVARWWRLPKDIVSIIDRTGDESILSIAKFSTSAASCIREGKHEELKSMLIELDVPKEVKLKAAGAIRGKIAELAKKPIVKPAAEEPIAPAKEPAKYAGLSIEEGLLTLQADVLKDAKVINSCPTAAQEFVNNLRDITKATHCLLMFPKNGFNYRISYGVGPDLDRLKDRLELNQRGRTTVMTSMLDNSIDVTVSDFAKLNAKSLPDFLPDLMPTAKMLVMLPVISEKYISSVLFLAWGEPNSLQPAEVNLLKALRTACAKYLYSIPQDAKNV